MPDPAIVVFSNQTDIWWLKFLRRGFRHCFVLMKKNGIWVSVDPLAHQTDVALIDVPDGFNLVEWLQDEESVVISTCTRTAPIRPFLPLPATCVETVKRILGIRAAHILTPWQLYRYLKKEI